MKIALISDIHGNAVALEAVLADIKKKQVNQICVLGDICYRGPEPKRCLELVQSLEAHVIKGNADEWVVRGVQQGEVPDQALELMNRERDWIVSQLDQKDLDYLSNLPQELQLKIDNISIHGFHATPNSLFEVVLPHTEDETIQSKMMSSVDANVYVHGHIHKSYIRMIQGKVMMNIGSVGLPFDGIAQSSYGIIEVNDGNISTSIERVSFDIEKVIETYKEVNYPNTDMMANILRNARV